MPGLMILTGRCKGRAALPEFFSALRKHGPRPQHQVVTLRRQNKPDARPRVVLRVSNTCLPLSRPLAGSVMSRLASASPSKSQGSLRSSPSWGSSWGSSYRCPRSSGSSPPPSPSGGQPEALARPTACVMVGRW